MFVQSVVPTTPPQTYHKCESQSTVGSQNQSHRIAGSQIQEFSLDLESPKPKLCTKLSSVTAHTQGSQCSEGAELPGLLKGSQLACTSKTQSCTMYFDGMYCEDGIQCMFSHQQSSRSHRKQQTPSTSLFQLLEQYPELALLRGNRRGYSLFFN